MNYSQENDLMPLLIELGILPCLGILLLIVGLFYIIVNLIGREKPERHTDDAFFAIFTLLSSTILLVVGVGFLAGAILINLMNSALNGQPIHWF